MEYVQTIISNLSRSAREPIAGSASAFQGESIQPPDAGQEEEHYFYRVGSPEKRALYMKWSAVAFSLLLLALTVYLMRNPAAGTDSASRQEASSDAASNP